jgi:prevent-host-death family protein
LVKSAEDVLGTTVSVARAKSQFAALVARAEAGEKIIVTRRGRAVACLGPLPGRQPIKYGELSGVFLAEDLTIPEEVIRDFESSKRSPLYESTPISFSGRGSRRNGSPPANGACSMTRGHVT